MASVNTQFSIAVHLLAGLASREGLVTSEALAESVNTNPAFVKRVLAKMSRAALIRTHTGKLGGCELARGAEKITLRDVYVAVEAPKAFAIHSYPANKSCVISRNIKGVMGEVSIAAQQAFEAEIAKTTIADIVQKIEAS
ncbi:MAG: Rrf2 family transcriptional regulator [Proteobacteria bacterium]|nr:MAG: Rrf2 family transcriptional regulator [Pseudomonadota bacterium]